MFRPIRFCLTLLISLLALYGMARLLFLLAGFPVSLSPAPFACIVIAALLEGHHYGKSNKKRPSRDATWVAAISMTAMSVLVLDAIYAVFRIFSPSHIASLSQIDPVNFAFALIGLSVATCVAVRFSYEAGLKLVLDRYTS
ncbi:ABZJ_00895 family protein [uncultured Roseobacter sp.]|uniref:ABZJ_00895 family protein n=1 Tax=uncultured Roseobacter sp. TaxID=114847 RepID=UPI002639FA79|nr:ABZJ_00895 family protein [uncultured Roseobacter sp.]